MCSTALAGEDYVQVFTDIVFLNGQSSNGNNEQCTYISILDDDILEDNEKFSVVATANGPVNLLDGIIAITIQEDPLDSEYFTISVEAVLRINLLQQL